jgi:hypothetical protein
MPVADVPKYSYKTRIAETVMQKDCETRSLDLSLKSLLVLRFAITCHERWELYNNEKTTSKYGV